MAKVETVEGNTSGGAKLVANGGCVAHKQYDLNYPRIHSIWHPKYKKGEGEKIAKEAAKYIGYLEKKSPEQLEDFTANAGKNNYTMFAPHAAKATGKTGIFANGYPWCCTFDMDTGIRALDVNRIKELFYSWTASCNTFYNYLQKAGATQVKDHSKAAAGDIIFFKNSEGICHVGIVVNGIKINKEPAATTYSKEEFIKDIQNVLGTRSAYRSYLASPKITKTYNNVHKCVMPIQKYLKAMGFYKGVVDGKFGTLTEEAVREYQKKYTFTVDGFLSAKGKTWKSLLGV